MSPEKQKASARLKLQVIQMKRYMLLNQISNTEVARLSGITTPNVWRFINNKSPEPSVLTFLMIAEAIGYEVIINPPKK